MGCLHAAQMGKVRDPDGFARLLWVARSAHASPAAACTEICSLLAGGADVAARADTGDTALTFLVSSELKYWCAPQLHIKGSPTTLEGVDVAAPADTGVSAICFPGVLGAQALVRIQVKRPQKHTRAVLVWQRGFVDTCQHMWCPWSSNTCAP